ncbi:MAG: hypothetical protein U9Q96_00335 [Patescibacteria group bacterium]|nr:hypothetical protein [Patescibacteria group bacterium]
MKYLANLGWLAQHPKLGVPFLICLFMIGAMFFYDRKKILAEKQRMEIGQENRSDSSETLIWIGSMFLWVWIARWGWAFVFMRSFPPTWADVSRIAAGSIYSWPISFLPVCMIFCSARMALKSLRDRDVHATYENEGNI